MENPDGILSTISGRIAGGNPVASPDKFSEEFQMKFLVELSVYSRCNS